MRSGKTGLVALVLPIIPMVVAGCGGSVSAIKCDYLTRRPATSELILAKDFATEETKFHGDNADDPNVVNNQKRKIPAEITRSLLRRFRRAGYTADEYSAAAATRKALVIKGEVTEVHHGSGAARFFVGGFGAGAAWMKANVKICRTDNPSEILADIVVEGSSGGSGGVAGVGDHTVANCDEIAEGIVEFLVHKPE